MPLPVLVNSFRQDWVLQSVDELRDVLASADRRGGGEFWLTAPEQGFPSLAIRTSAGQADVHYFPTEAHPGFRRLSERHQPGDVVFQFEGCDPSDGESVSAEFVVPLVEVIAIAEYFVQHGGMSEPSRWLEL